ncbi:hypothetical protein M0812_06586 [Anaeramoeba flamelloides]|uniref:GRAM domain-containing protein n=1 Tax=Anaeramoeba flamelloides TaxID=1746091 RepID=A0AAV8A9W3_9EUKA|nr:hypothetical protein M0812_06586 [Anaeramoeba flamelloides]
MNLFNKNKFKIDDKGNDYIDEDDTRIQIISQKVGILKTLQIGIIERGIQIVSRGLIEIYKDKLILYTCKKVIFFNLLEIDLVPNFDKVNILEIFSKEKIIQKIYFQSRSERGDFMRIIRKNIKELKNNYLNQEKAIKENNNKKIKSPIINIAKKENRDERGGKGKKEKGKENDRNTIKSTIINITKKENKDERGGRDKNSGIKKERKEEGEEGIKKENEIKKIPEIKKEKENDNIKLSLKKNEIKIENKQMNINKNDHLINNKKNKKNKKIYFEKIFNYNIKDPLQYKLISLKDDLSILSNVIIDLNSHEYLLLYFEMKNKTKKLNYLKNDFKISFNNQINRIIEIKYFNMNKKLKKKYCFFPEQKNFDKFIFELSNKMIPNEQLDDNIEMSSSLSHITNKKKIIIDSNKIYFDDELLLEEFYKQSILYKQNRITQQFISSSQHAIDTLTKKFKVFLLDNYLTIISSGKLKLQYSHIKIKLSDKFFKIKANQIKIYLHPKNKRLFLMKINKEYLLILFQNPEERDEFTTLFQVICKLYNNYNNIHTHNHNLKENRGRENKNINDNEGGGGGEGEGEGEEGNELIFYSYNKLNIRKIKSAILEQKNYQVNKLINKYVQKIASKALIQFTQVGKQFAGEDYFLNKNDFTQKDGSRMFVIHLINPQLTENVENAILKIDQNSILIQSNTRKFIISLNNLRDCNLFLRPIQDSVACLKIYNDFSIYLSFESKRGCRRFAQKFKVMKNFENFFELQWEVTLANQVATLFVNSKIIELRHKFAVISTFPVNKIAVRKTLNNLKKSKFSQAEIQFNNSLEFIQFHSPFAFQEFISVIKHFGATIINNNQSQSLTKIDNDKKRNNKRNGGNVRKENKK